MCGTGLEWKQWWLTGSWLGELPEDAGEEVVSGGCRGRDNASPPGHVQSKVPGRGEVSRGSWAWSFRERPNFII